MKLRTSLVLVSILLTMVASSGCNQPVGGKKKLRIAVIPKGTTHEFWKSIHAGSVKAINELKAEGTDVEIIWKGPLKEDDREQQVQVVEGFIAEGVDGIVLAPLDNKALVRPVEEAKKAGIPTIIIDSGLDSDQISSFVATDNRKGGVLAAERLGEVMGGKGKVLVLRYQEGSASTNEREEGFLETIKAKFPQIEIVSSNQYAGATRDTAKQKSENLLNQFGDSIQGIFTPNESATSGMLLALQDFGKAGKIKFVGFDTSASFFDAMKADQLQGIVVQNPFNMGYLGVKTMVASLTGKPIEKRIDTGVVMVTPDKVNTPEIQSILHPPIEQ